MSKQKHSIHLVFDVPCIETYFDVTDPDLKQLKKVKSHIDSYEFDSVDEVEAFRIGLCASYGKNVKDFLELTDANIRSLSDRIKKAEKFRRELN